MTHLLEKNLKTIFPMHRLIKFGTGDIVIQPEINNDSIRIYIYNGDDAIKVAHIDVSIKNVVVLDKDGTSLNIRKRALWNNDKFNNLYSTGVVDPSIEYISDSKILLSFDAFKLIVNIAEAYLSIYDDDDIIISSILVNLTPMGLTVPVYDLSTAVVQ